MSPLVAIVFLVLAVMLIGGSPRVYRDYGPVWTGSGLGTILIIVIILYLLGVLR